MCRPLLATALLLAAVSVGCQRQDLQARREGAEQVLCERLAEVGKALGNVEALQPTSTVGEARAADRELAAAMERLEQSEAKVQRLRLEEFKVQLKAFRSEVARVARQENLTLQQAAAELKQKAAPVVTARRDLSAEVNCRPEPAATP